MTVALFLLFEQRVAAVHLICILCPSSAGRALTRDLSEAEAKAKVVPCVVHAQERNVQAAG